MAICERDNPVWLTMTDEEKRKSNLMDERFDRIIRSIIQRATPETIDPICNELDDLLEKLEHPEPGEDIPLTHMANYAYRMSQLFEQNGYGAQYVHYLEKSQQYFQRFIDSQDAFMDLSLMKNSLPTIDYEIAHYYFDQRELDKSEEYVARALKKFIKLKEEGELLDPVLYGNTLYWQSLIEGSRGNIAKAEKFDKEAREYLPEEYFDED